ncbi:competence protein [Gracilibacillus halophilus YIM-C55.5]|uniref:Competence protein n=1 Tax=Gracilibacillus halophilus YIM-C55.5 TaxID=1308866 RepID=N4WMS8_9BACI|nr:type II secretion system F family protein [Gracilibacillus halophilus]ENH97457.1 competence protein [Gracilibacillus halophilus YIM-C55.5]
MVSLRKPFFHIPHFKKSLSLSDQHHFLSRLHQLLEHGYPLHDALQMVAWEEKLASTAEQITNTLLTGQSFVQALKLAKFHPQIISFLTISLKHGKITAGLYQCCMMLKQQIYFLTKLKQMSRYPMMLFLMFFIIVYFMKTSIFPSFQQFFTGDQTSHIFYWSRWMIESIFYCLLVAIILTIIGVTFPGLLKQRVKLTTKTRWILRIPFYRVYKKLQLSFLFCVHTSSLLDTGITLKDALTLLQKKDNNAYIRDVCFHITQGLREGLPIQRLINDAVLLEDELSSIFQKNKNTNQLAQDLNVYATFAFDTMEKLLHHWVRLLQPILFCFIALFIIVIYLSFMLPMFDLMKTI